MDDRYHNMLRGMNLPRGLLAEFIGVFALMFITGGTVIVTGGDNLVAAALANGIIITVMIATLFHVSGAQFNPAVSIAVALLGKQSWSRCACFILAQVAGATFAAWLLWATLLGVMDAPTLGAGQDTLEHVGLTVGMFSDLDQLGVTDSGWRVMVLELIAAFFLMFVIMGVIVDRRSGHDTPVLMAIPVGLIVAADILCFGPLTGASMNPARSFGPALVLDYWHLQWAYWVGPILGAALAAWTYQALIGRSD
ncbi:MAG: aquaporin [Phycisphaerales bacterium]|nr:aquaporin [Phycisphaerales bacterium]